ncbi:dicarboxylate/amino acid:cation symporter [Flavisphingomonas formosensis]|uniref:dicarboxylate/amino acid:cation symporter n=1 Tax=Flavisphingomonas formosensis TaxID=861534 RepID=UPI0012FA2732|nr:cation:dicarboxylase symporter family transporter [Sphingomonas formosensis]
MHHAASKTGGKAAQPQAGNGARGPLLALAAGLATGFAIRGSGEPALLALAAAVKPLGTLWLNALRMTLVPLIFSLVASAIGRLAALETRARAAGLIAALFAAMLLIGTTYGLAAAHFLLALWPTPPIALTELAGTSPAAAQASVPLVDQLIALLPVNPVGAAAEGQMAPLVIFAVIFGIAATRIAPDRRSLLVATIEAVADTMMAIVHGVLKLAPAGIFLLALEIALQAGFAIATMLGQMVIMTCIVVLGGIAFCHLVARVAGGIGWRHFAIAAAGPQAVAAGTCSSLATLPAMIEAAEGGLGLDPVIASTTLPLAASSFRFATAMTGCMECLFAAHAAGISLAPGQYVVIVAISLLTNIGVVGLPGAAVIYAADAPLFQAAGAPLGFLPLWIAVFAIPDIFVTMGNVTADLAVTTVVARLLRRGAAAEAMPLPA